MVYKQSLAATAAPLLMVAGWDEVLATAFLWKLTCRHRGLFQSIDEPGTPGSVIVHNGNPLFQEYNLVQQVGNQTHRLSTGFGGCCCLFRKYY